MAWRESVVRETYPVPYKEVKEMDHKHFGYWINRERGWARCYECGFQFDAKSDADAEPWLADQSS